MFDHQDTFVIDGEHFRVIAVYEELEDYESEVYELSSRHNPSRENKLLIEDELEKFEQVTDTDDVVYLEHHANKLAEVAERLHQNKKAGNISQLGDDLRAIENRIKEVRRNKRAVEENL